MPKSNTSVNDASHNSTLISEYLSLSLSLPKTRICRSMLWRTSSSAEDLTHFLKNGRLVQEETSRITWPRKINESVSFSASVKQGIAQRRKEKMLNHKGEHVIEPNVYFSLSAMGHVKKRGYSRFVWRDSSAQKVVQVWGDEWEKEEFSGWHTTVLENKHWN